MNKTKQKVPLPHEHEDIKLNAEEQQRFLSLLENSPEPNENVKKLFKKHQNQS